MHFSIRISYLPTVQKFYRAYNERKQPAPITDGQR